MTADLARVLVTLPVFWGGLTLRDEEDNVLAAVDLAAFEAFGLDSVVAATDLSAFVTRFEASTLPALDLADALALRLASVFDALDALLFDGFFTI